MADEFNVAALLKLGKDKLAVRLGELTRAQVGELLAGERAQGATARSGVLKLLTAELDARAAELSPGSVALIAKALVRILAESAPWDDLPPEEQAAVVVNVQAVLASPGTADETNMFDRIVLTLNPIFNQIEALAAVVDHAPERETVGPGSAAEMVPQMDDAAQGKLLDKVVALAFCEGDHVRFKVAATAADFEPALGIARYGPRIVLERKKPRVRVDTVVALDADGKPIARRKWPKALEGGGGTEAVFPARSISFEL